MKDPVDFRGTAIAPSSLVELLQLRAEYQPEQLVYTFLEDGENEAGCLTYGQLDHRAKLVASQLNHLGADGARALLLYPPGLEFIVGFFGCLYAGITAVPVYPPDPSRLNRTLPRLQAVCADAQPEFVLTTAPILALAELFFAQAPDLQALTWVTTDNFSEDLLSEWQAPKISGDTLAFLQYTSGSTGTPKGVMLSHDNLLHNASLIAQAFSITSTDTVVTWLPPYHDMGLIGGILQPIRWDLPCIVMPPLAFLQRPFNWLQTISRYRATISGGPNFAFDLCVRKISDEQRTTLDLSSWRVAFNGAEPVRAETLARFSSIFASCGFQSLAFEPCYGLAEATLIASGDTKGTSPAYRTIQTSSLGHNRVVDIAGNVDQAARQTLVGSGQTLGDQEIIIVRPETFTRLPSEQIGEVWLAGHSVAQGYWNRPEETVETFQAYLDTGEGPYLRTGDLGFLHEGELFVTGRAKDLIIIRGRNHYPQDIELTVEKSHSALRKGCGAAFGVDVDNEERLVVVQEVYTHQPLDADEVIQTIRQAVAEEHEVQVYGVVLIKPRTISKTSSGKIQRRACRQQYLDGELAIVETHVLQNLGAEQRWQTPEPLLVKAFRSLPESERQAVLTAHLQELMARAMGVSPKQLDPLRPLPSLGLDSATAVEVAYEIELALGVQLRLENLLQEITMAELAAQLVAELTAAKADETAVSTPAPQLSTDPDPAVYPLSHGQRALWFLHQLQPDSPAYNVVHAAKVHASLDESAFQRVFQTLVNRHPCLRTTFSAVNGEPVQMVHAKQAVCFQIEEAVTWDEAQVKGRIAEEIYRPFDLENGPLMRVHLFRRSSQQYILILALHHIVTDLWSSAVLMNEIGQLYEAECGGKRAKLKPLPITYVEHVQRQNEMLAGQKGEELRRYWLEQLAGEPLTLNLPTDRPKTAASSHRGALESIQLNPQLTTRLKELAKAHNATPFMILLTAFYILLHRYTGQDDLLIGTTRANRTRDVARLVGYFVNPLVIRANLTKNPPFAKLLAQVRQTTLDAFAHGDYPFPLLVEQLQPTRESGQSPLFQVMFTWQKTTRLMKGQDVTAVALNQSDKRLMMGPLPLESMHLDQWVSPFDLTLLMAETGNGEDAQFVASFEYRTDLFDPATIQRMLTHFETLLTGIVANPQERPSALPMLTEAEQTQLLVEWNRTIEPRLTPFVPHQIEQWSRLTPEVVALQLEDTQLTYEQLNQKANQLAHHLQRLGIGPNAHVGVYTERSIEAVIALLAVLKAGGTYLPIDPTYPQERLAFILADAEVRLLLTQASLMPRLHSFSVPIVCLDVDWPAVAQEPVENPTASLEPENVAYMIYTSGSTGKPKGVLISHGAIADHIQTISEHFQLTTSDRVLQFASFSFDQGLEQILATFASGAQLILRGSTIWPPADFPRFVAEQQLSVINLPPAYWEQVVHAWSKEPIPVALLRLVIIGGDVVQPATVALWHKLPLRGVRLLNAYGPTETTITATTFEIPDNGEPPDPMPIGRPLPNRSAFILDKNGHLLPVGVPGELHIGGPSLANGYWRRPELTAERFVQLSEISKQYSVFSKELITDHRPLTTAHWPLNTVYRTGDLCRYLPDGNIEFLGRVDHQVKVRGFRIELGEIEAILNQHPAVQQAAVLVHAGGASKKLVAYLSVPQADKPTYSQFKQYLKRQLPDYMVPAHIIILDTLPMTVSGKLDRRLLPKLSPAQPELSTSYVAPRSPVEVALTQMWAALLEVEKVGIFDNFFDLGGHSLLATKLASQLRTRFAVDIPLRDLFEAATVAELSLRLAQHQAAAAEDAEVAALLEEIDQLSDEDVTKLLMTENA